MQTYSHKYVISHNPWPLGLVSLAGVTTHVHKTKRLASLASGLEYLLQTNHGIIMVDFLEESMVDRLSFLWC